LLCDLGNFLLLHVPQRVARPVFARQAFDIRQGFDIGELARLVLLQGLEKLRQRAFVLLPCLFRLRAFGLEGLVDSCATSCGGAPSARGPLGCG
jgi:hypothetical protein